MLTFLQIKTKLRRATGTDSTNYTDANIAVDVNLAQNEVWCEALKVNGWNIDDFNQSDYPIIYTNLVSGQRSYAFVTDESGNYILDIYKVQVMDSSGVYHDITPVDQQSVVVGITPTTLTDGQNTTGTPTTYDKTGNGIFLDVIPSYSKTKGLKIFINREPTYFTSSDTTKVSGIDPLCHEYLYLKPAYEWARDKGLSNREAIYRDLQLSMAKIKTRYGNKEKDIIKKIRPMYQNNK